MIKVVFDTNIYISAILFGGTPEKALRLARNKKIEILISECIILEIAEILKSKFLWEDPRIAHTLESIRNFTSLITPTKQIKVIKNCISDNKILECASEGKARYIITGDKKHLLPLKEFSEIKTITASRFLEIMNK